MSSQSINVLHVDDEPDFADMAAEFLEREDERLDVETATGAREGLDRLAEADFDCVVSDYDMPRVNGIEFLERVREKYPDLPFILFTGKGSEAVASDAISAGVTDYLQKGGDTSQYELLENRITNAVESYRTERRAELQRRQYRDFFQEAPVMYVVTRDDGGQLHIEDCNDRFLERLGYDREEVIDRPISDFYAEESKRKMHHEGGYEQALDGGFGIQERTLVAADGERVHVLNRANPRLDSQGTPIGAQGMYLDITERKEPERRLELALQQTRSGVWEFDAESGMVTRHEGATDLWADDAYTTVPMADAIAERVHPEDQEAVWDALEAAVEDDDPYHVQFRHTTPDGYRWAEARGDLVRETDADSGRLIACTTDIHAHKEREQRLRETTARLMALFEHSPDMINVHDTEGNIIDPNPRLCEKTGYDEADLTDMKVWDLDRAMAPDEARTLWEGMDTSDRRELEGRYEHRDGSTFPVEVHVRRLDLDGKDHFVAISRDISERKEREAHLREERDRLSALFDDAPQPMIEGELKGDDHYPIVGVNDAFETTFGYDAAEIVGRDIADALVPEDERAEHERFRERVADGESFSAEVDRTTVDGDRTFLIDVVSYGTDSTPADGWFATYTDITERKERERELELYETIVETVPDGVYAMDENFRYIAMNQARAELSGYTRDELIGSHMSRINTEEAVEMAKRDRARMLENGVDDEIRTVEQTYVTPDGEEVPCEVRMRALPPADDGSFRGTAGVVRDISERKEYEEELEEYREYTDRLLDAVDDLFFVLDEEGTLQRWDDSLADVTGYDDEGIGSMSGTDFVAEEHRERATAAIQEVFETGHARLEAPLLTKDGTTIPYEYVADRVEHPDGDLRLVGIGRDISERKEREQELELYETMVETVPDGVYALNEDFEYIAVNQGMADLTGYSKEELIGSHFSLVNTEDVIDKAERQREQLVANGGEGAIMTAEHAHLTADGESVPTEVRFRALPPAEDGSFRGTAGVVRDITERKRRERELERYEQIVNTMDEAACIYDEQGRFVVANEYLADFYGTTPAALEGEPSNLIPRIRDEYGEDVYEQLLDGEREEIRGEIDGEFPGHGYEVLSYRLTPLLVDGEIEGAVGVAREVTAQRQRERELERQNERLEQFASVVSHDLRNPLNVAEGNVELAQEECDSEHLDTVVRALDRMDALIEDILTVAREGTEVETVEPVDLAAVVEGCWRNVATTDATLVVDTELTIDADRSRFQQLLENLVRNAVEHGGTDVTVTIGDFDDERGFYVADDGPGIPADERDDVFEYGYSTAEDGTGFGLAIVKEIAEAHGWTIDVTDSESGGARFEIIGVETDA